MISDVARSTKTVGQTMNNGKRGGLIGIYTVVDMRTYARYEYEYKIMKKKKGQPWVNLLVNNCFLYP
jgi:hypothetical protein